MCLGKGEPHTGTPSALQHPQQEKRCPVCLERKTDVRDAVNGHHGEVNDPTSDIIRQVSEDGRCEAGYDHVRSDGQVDLAN
jgi:hypothetical protein